MLAYRAPEAGEHGDDLFGIAMNYAFVAKAFRRQDYLGKLVQIAREVAADALDTRPEAFLVFLEINNPTKMSQEDIQLDSELSGIDQDSRLLVWERIGASVIDVDYVQPPLSDDGQAPETRLLLAVIAPTRRQQLDSKILRAHLERFFGISVLKGKDLPEVAMAQIQACQARHDGYALLAPSGFTFGKRTVEQAPEKIVNKSAVNVLLLYILIPFLIGMAMVSHGGKAEPLGDNGNNKMRITTEQPGRF